MTRTEKLGAAERRARRSFACRAASHAPRTHPARRIQTQSTRLPRQKPVRQVKTRPARAVRPPLPASQSG
eukprot:284979-Prymnesium_polylepis.2